MVVLVDAPHGAEVVARVVVDELGEVGAEHNHKDFKRKVAVAQLGLHAAVRLGPGGVLPGEPAAQKGIKEEDVFRENIMFKMRSMRDKLEDRPMGEA